jgi:hypothetical protein
MLRAWRLREAAVLPRQLKGLGRARPAHADKFVLLCMGLFSSFFAISLVRDGT